MRPRIAIPMPHSTDHKYSERAMPQYERAVALAGGEPIRIPLDQPTAEVMSLIRSCDGVLLPGSNADVEPARFKQDRSSHTAAADLRREEVDAFLLDDAYAQRKPVLGVCYGLQSLNVFRKGSLVQHIPDFLPEKVRMKVDHEAGSKVAVAHTVVIERSSALGKIVCGDSRLGCRSEGEGRQESALDGEGHGLSRADNASQEDGALAPEVSALIVPVNSSHHQSAGSIGDGLRIVARCPDDEIVEAVEGTSPDHFVLAVQWHPERSVEDNAAARGIFQALIEAAHHNP